MSKEALEIATINARLFNRQIIYAESLRLIPGKAKVWKINN